MVFLVVLPPLNCLVLLPGATCAFDTTQSNPTQHTFMTSFHPVCGVIPPVHTRAISSTARASPAGVITKHPTHIFIIIFSSKKLPKSEIQVELLRSIVVQTTSCAAYSATTAHRHVFHTSPGRTFIIYIVSHNVPPYLLYHITCLGDVRRIEDIVSRNK